MNNDSEKKLDLDSPYSIGSEDYQTLKKNIQFTYGERRINCVLELGSGVSTIQLSKDFSDTRIYSLENNHEILQANSRKLEDIGARHTSIVYAPIRIQLSRMGGVYPTYCISRLPQDVIFDVVIIDGPVERLYPRGREGALYLLFDKLKVGGLIALDDYHRASAKSAVHNWQQVFFDCIDIVEETPSFIVLKKTDKNIKNPGMKPRIMAASYASLIYSTYINARRNILVLIRLMIRR